MYVCTYASTSAVHRCRPRVVGSQAFNQAQAFNANIASWNVLRVIVYNSAFEDVFGLEDCIKRGVYDNWRSTLQSAYPTWSSVCINGSNIGAAVTAWVTDPTTATTTYGNVAGWNIAGVTSMASLFLSKPTFNADISKWNVASVVDMYQACMLRRSLCGMFVYRLYVSLSLSKHLPTLMH